VYADEHVCMETEEEKTTVFIEEFYKILATRKDILEHLIACNVIVCN